MKSHIFGRESTMRAYGVEVALLVLGCVVGRPSAAQLVQTAETQDTASQTWNAIGSHALSPDGQWFAYVVLQHSWRPALAYSDAVGGGTLVIRRTAKGAAETRIPVKGDVSGLAISGDSKWLAYVPPGGAVTLVNLATGDTRAFDGVGQLAFSPDATEIALHGSASDRNALLLYNLSTSESKDMGAVSGYAFSPDSAWLAYARTGGDSSGVWLLDRRTQHVLALDTGASSYGTLTWVNGGRAISVVRRQIDPTNADTADVLEAFASLSDNGAASKLVFDPTRQANFPKGWQLAPYDVRYADDLSAVFFRIQQRSEKTDDTTGASKPTSLPALILWHWKDRVIQPGQISDRSRPSYLAEYRFAEHRFVQLADSTLPYVATTRGDRYAYGANDTGYRIENSVSYGNAYRDVYLVDLKTGERRLVLRKHPMEYTQPYSNDVSGDLFLSSPDGTHVLYWGIDGHFWVMDLATGDTTNLTRGLPVRFTEVSNGYYREYAYPAPNWAAPLGTWTKDGSAVVLSDGWDLWKVPVSPGKGRAVNLTQDGRARQIHYWLLMPWGDGPREHDVDLSRPMYLRTRGEWTKRQGIALLEPGRTGAKSLLSVDADMGDEVFTPDGSMLYSRADATAAPEYWLLAPGTSVTYPLTNVNAGLPPRWSSGSRLISYRSTKGDRLQGALYLPQGYEQGKTYPMVVIIYEKEAGMIHYFMPPGDIFAYDRDFFTAHGYAVLEPDIAYRVNEPMRSAAWCVVPAAQAAVATGIVDPKRVGLMGHSMGGSETGFIITQTSLFAAAIESAGITDMANWYTSEYGQGEPAEFADQLRMSGSPSANPQGYVLNSSLYFANRITTPLLILHNDQDDAVPFTHGVDFYDELRQLGKTVIMLQYLGEGHGLSIGRGPDQLDRNVRVAEWFDHYLKGAPAPDWMVNGVSWRDMPAHLKARTAGKGGL